MEIKTTKKEFLEKIDFHVYGNHRDSMVKAIFYDHKENGYKYCIYARATNATKKQLIDELFGVLTGKIEDTSWWMQLVIAQTDEERFKVPIVASGLRHLIKHKS